MAASSPPARPLRRVGRAFAVIAGFAIVTLVVGAIVVRRQQRLLRQSSGHFIEAVVDFRTSQLSRWLAERRGDAQVVARDAAVARVVAGSGAGATEREAALRRLHVIADSYGYKAMVVLDRDGNRRLALGTDAELELDSLTLAGRATATGKVQFSEFRRARTGGDGLTFDIVTPLFAEAEPNPQIAGSVVLRVDPTKTLVEILTVKGGASRSGELTLLAHNAGGDLFIYPRLRNLGQPWLADRPPGPGTAEALTAGRVVLEDAVDSEGLPVLAASTPLPETSAIVVGHIRTEELVADASRAAWLSVGLLAAILLSLALVAQNRARAEAEAALRASQEKFKAIFDNMQDGYMLARMDGAILLVNPALVRMLGYASDADLLGKSSERDVFDDPADRASLKAKLTADGTAQGHKATFKRADGERIIVEGNVRLVRDKSGKPFAIEGVVRDMTANYRNRAELIEAREAAMAAARAKSQFLANMSHEIRTPLNAIVGLGHLLQRSELPGQQRDYVKKIQASSTMLLQAVNDVLDVSKIEAGKLELERAPFRLDELVDGVVDMLTVPANEKRLQLSCRIAEEVPAHLVGDPLRLRQVLTNLAGNAIKFTDKGEVSIRVELVSRSNARAEIRFAVRDTGIGIAPSEQARIFEPFAQADGSTTRRFGGSGLGLAICREVVEMMGGVLGVESRPGAGSTFSFAVAFGLPSAQTVASGDTAATDRSIADSLRGRSVLVAEDNAINQQVARGLLEAVGVNVVIAQNGKEAADAVAAPDARFDAVLMDMQMPVLDGLEATRAIRRDATRARLPIIAMTAHALTAERNRCLAAGMNDYVAKPVEPGQLYATLARCLTEPQPALQLPGIDVAGALERLGGDHVLYRRLLGDLAGEWAVRIDGIGTMIASGDVQGARRTAHMLKGSSATLGVVPLADAAAALEKALARPSDGHDGALGALLAEVRERVAATTVLIRTQAPASPATGELGR
jgi:PAS domain S-box-containing protein